MTGTNTAPRYSTEDLETASIRSAAPSYVSDAPSYHSTIPHPEAAPLYTPRRTISSAQSTVAAQADLNDDQRRQEPTRLETIGLPPVPQRQPTRIAPHFSFPMWSAADTPTTRHYRNVAERRVVDGRYQTASSPERQRISRLLEEQNAANDEAFRPLEDPYLVGEQAAAEAKRERLAREGTNTSIQQEERQWDWLIAQMKGWEERERSWTRIRGEADALQRKRLSRRVGRLLSMP
ncbi:hypothetical protein LLEC1_00212 [Akanthomyces lecanii]|uniref:Uncharacterized protein n=1 Tax=Cordyceps confragosa TaxID=2714763 RepID=A0A179IJI2_CORDF|nr:hypothetical protein LLEC1_00212 [Akanthomyces lecanii]